MKIENLKGCFWTAKKIENTYIVSVHEGISLVAGLLNFILDQKLPAGKISGVSVASDIIFRFFNQFDKKYEFGEFPGKDEILNVLGSFLIMHGELRLSLEASLKRGGNINMAAQLTDAKISGVNKFFFHPVNTLITASKDEELRLQMN